jgi:hypothetical protein
MAYSEFEFDIPAGIRRELPLHFGKLKSTQLTEQAVAQIPEKAQGAYLLFYDGALVYVGKTDAKRGFKSRLGRHLNNVQHRKDLDPGKVAFKAVRIFVFSNFDLEAMLIEEYTEHYGAKPFWNFSGFGSNDPGHNREGQDPAEFDLLHPVDIHRELTLSPGDRPLLEVLLELKNVVPYRFRYQRDKGKGYRVGHVDMRGLSIDVPQPPVTARQILKLVLDVLPDGWQATVLPNRVILYKEDTVYTSQVEALRKGQP